jgi:hypothetical protein
MKIINHNKGRLGNSIFRLFSNIVFLTVYDIDGEITNGHAHYDILVDDMFFVNWSNSVLNGKIPVISKYTTLHFCGFYQHDKIFMFFKNEIINYINNHPNLLLTTDRNEIYRAHELINYNLDKKYKIVVHIRLEDFLEINQVLNPLSICKLIDQILIKTNDTNICFVVNQPKTELEFKYINFFKKKYNNIIIESNDPIKDFNLMRNAEFLICSYSTLSWCAAFLSDTVKEVYIPDYNIQLHQTFKNINNTILYNYYPCSADELNCILSER